MRRNWRRIRRALGAPLSALMLFVGAAGPFLDAADLVAETRVEANRGHEPGASGHDHRLCIQVGANQAIPSHEGLGPPGWSTRAADPGAPVPSGLPSREHATPTARAPPSR